MSKDYYKILGINKNASKEQIKKAFHSLALKYHPDKNNGDDKKFKEINEAYQTLSNEKKRTDYDRFGSDNMNGFSQAGQQSNWAGFNGAQNGFSQDMGGFDMGDLGDIFGDFFGGARNRRDTRRGRDISTEIKLSFEESIFGTTRKIKINKQSTCNTCGGSGAKKNLKWRFVKVVMGKERSAKRNVLFLVIFQVLKYVDLVMAQVKSLLKNVPIAVEQVSVKKKKKLTLKFHLELMKEKWFA